MSRLRAVKSKNRMKRRRLLLERRLPRKSQSATRERRTKRDE
jgi:hypothetical protein